MKGAAPIIKKQLVAMGIASVLATVLLAMTFLKVPEHLGIGRHEVTVDFAQAAGLYPGAEVVYLGHPVGKVLGLEITDEGNRVTLSLENDTEVPGSVRADIRSRSAIGEQYITLVPVEGADGPVLADGDHIPMERSTFPVEIGPVLDNAQALVSSIDEDALDRFVGEAGTAFDGRANDLQDILDSGTALIEKADENFEPTASLLREAGPVLNSINEESEAIRGLSTNLARFTASLSEADPQLRALIAQGPGFATQTRALFEDLSDSVPPFLKQTTPVLRTLSVFDAHIASVLSDMPLASAALQSVTAENRDTNHLRLTLANVLKPTDCTEGYLPANQWSSVYEQAPETTPLVYCKAPKSDSRAVRGARNIPCVNNPSRREGEFVNC
ncbi:phospholipid/cholesterol/gamma-HCH transport system substrate-binding protein [Nocardioides sp. J9]|nr:phospholipid/cholesterol/gamma-HCH transport system substrate-binding protein [Nocardioides sp. J9]